MSTLENLADSAAKMITDRSEEITRLREKCRKMEEAGDAILDAMCIYVPNIYIAQSAMTKWQEAKR